VDNNLNTREITEQLVERRSKYLTVVTELPSVYSKSAVQQKNYSDFHPAFFKVAIII
jgi:hypothetical protein